MVKVPFVIPGLVDGEKDIKVIEDSFKERGWLNSEGKIKFLFEFKTLPGKGGEGGRNDAVFMWEGDSKAMGKFAVQRFIMGSDSPSWHDDYLMNNKSIIPASAKEKLKELD